MNCQFFPSTEFRYCTGLSPVIFLKKRLKEETGNTIEFMGVIKPELIGGFVLRIGNTRIDASYARQLREIRNQLIEKN